MNAATQYRAEILGCDSIIFVPIEKSKHDNVKNSVGDINNTAQIVFHLKNEKSNNGVNV